MVDDVSGCAYQQVWTYIEMSEVKPSLYVKMRVDNEDNVRARLETGERDGVN
jgi:hypothetical protein